VNPGSGLADAFIGDPADAGITGMSTNSFGLSATPRGSGAFVTASRSLSTALQVGATFSMQWGVDYDGGGSPDSDKGFNLFVGTNQVVKVNNSDSSDIFFNSIDTGMGAGNNAMTWSFTYTSATTLFVTANDRDGSGTFSTNVTVGGGLSSLSLYVTAEDLGVERQPYYNDFTVTTVPEPSTYALLGLSAAGLGAHLIRRRRR
jgi:hypothetical protein